MSPSAGTGPRDRMGQDRRRIARSGLGLIELVLAIAIMGIVMVGLFQALSHASSSYRERADGQDMLSQGQYALMRMTLFIRETADFSLPSEKKIKVVERVLDRFDNVTHHALPDGDGILDADSDANGLVDDSDSDPTEDVIFQLESGQILETLPNYGTAIPGDTLPPDPICDHVSELKIKKLSDDLLSIWLVLDDGRSRIELFTRVKARIMMP